MVTDHKGIKYSSISEMCRAYKVPYNVYLGRLKAGWAQKKVLETPYGYIDHVGKWFKTEKEMCKFHGVKYMTYRYRKNRGYSMEECLSIDAKPKHFKIVNNYQDTNKKECTDHIGQKFNSVKEMCEFWGVTQDLYCQRLKRGKKLQEALEGSYVLDHKGNKFKSKKEMCEFWKINYETYVKRVRKGYRLEDALTNPTRDKK